MSTSPHPRPGAFPPLHDGDLELVQSALAGRRGAVEELGERLLSVPRSLTARNLQLGQPLDEGALEAAVPEALAALWNRLPAYDGAAALEVWADHFCLAALLRRLETAARTPARGPMSVGSAAAEPEAERRELVRLNEALDTLVVQRVEGASLLRLRHFTGLTSEALNQRLGLSPGTARTLYYRGLRALHALLEGGGAARRGAVQHPALHDDLLPGLLAEAADPRHALAGSALADCGECQRAVDETLALTEQLERAGRDALTTVSLAESVRDAPGEERVAAALDPLLAPISDERRRVPWLGLALAVAAAGALFVLFVIDPLGAPDEAFGQSRVGSGSIQLEHPLGAVDSWGTFAWSSEVPADGWFSVRVLDADGVLVAESPEVRATLWTVDAEETQGWPERLTWEVRRYDSASVHLDTAFGEAWLSP